MGCDNRVELPELDAGLACSELPVDGGALLVAFLLQGLDPVLQSRDMGRRPREAAALEDPDLDLSLVQPTPMLGRGMELQPVQDGAGLCGREGVVERAGGVGIEVVLDQVDAFGVLVVFLDQTR